MKAIMISIKPKWYAKIMNGEKTIEVRKNKALASAIQKLIDENGYADIYVYCTKDNKNYLYKDYYEEITREKVFVSDEKPLIKTSQLLNGKVLFKFRCYKVEEIRVVEDNNYYENDFDYYYETETCISDESPFFFVNKNSLEKLSCLETDELDEYLGIKGGYAIHISDLEIFDEPKELSEFYKVGYLDKIKPIKVRPNLKDAYKSFEPIYNKVIEQNYKLTNAPQNFCYVEV